MKMLLFLLLALCVSVSEQIDKTVVEQVAGPGIVQAVVKLIQDKCVFEDDKLFLRRLAYVESKDGTASYTFRSGFYGGIWQVDEDKLNMTKMVSSSILDSVQAEYGVEWESVKWRDLLKPLHSALAARLYLQYLKETLAKDIPSQLSDQASYWVSYYNPTSAASKFVTLSEELPSSCDILADVVFMLDASGSVGLSNFNLTKDFIKSIIAELNIGPDFSSNSRVAVETFSYKVYPQFSLKAYDTISGYNDAIDKIPYASQNTHTDKALDYIRTSVFLPEEGARGADVPKIAVVITDGVSTIPSKTLTAAAALLESGVTVFAVGVGSKLSILELQAIASDPVCTHLSILENFKQFASFVVQIEQKVCNVETTLKNGTVSKILEGGTKYYSYELSENCAVWKVISAYGKANIYFSTDYQPSSARYDSIREVSPEKPGHFASHLTEGNLFITVEALSDVSLTFEIDNEDCQCPV